MTNKINLEKPIINLSPLEKTAVKTPTQKEYNELMKVYEMGGWKWCTGYLPTELNRWESYKEKMCISGETKSFDKNEQFGYCSEEFYKSEKYTIISTSDFYKKQGITKKDLNKINKYFEKLRK